MLFGKLKAALKKTREVLARGLSRLFSIGRKLDDGFLDELEQVLYQADLGPLGTSIVEQLKVAVPPENSSSALVSTSVPFSGSRMIAAATRPGSAPKSMRDRFTQ